MDQATYYCFITIFDMLVLLGNFQSKNKHETLLYYFYGGFNGTFLIGYIICKIRSQNINFFPKNYDSCLSADALNTISQHFIICFPKYKFPI